ncbi:MAG TPA: cysteine hydrolase [Dyadobacter sp.]|jgi:nicotinamidase-related amidase|nr:cysteine hydrolase [Dyadobacter sp.]
MSLTPRETAVVLIEFQNDFTTEGGIFHGAVKSVMDTTNMLKNTAETLAEARKAGINVIHVPISFTNDYHEVTPNPYGIMKGVVDNGAFKKDTWGTEFAESVKPEPGEIVIEGKRSFCGFASTNLDFVLRSRGIKNIALAGYLTNCCVESTMRTAYDKGYNVISLTDCCATLSQEEHDNAIKNDFPMFSQPMSHADFIAILKNEAALDLKGKGYE